MLEAFTRAVPADDRRLSADSAIVVLDDSDCDMDEGRGVNAEPASMPRERRALPVATRMRLRGA